MREIKFRGYCKDELIGNQWLTNGYGVSNIDYVNGERDTFLTTPYGDYYVYEESVGQYTGLKDKNGKEIYEGDILERKFSGLGNELGDRTFVSWDRYRFVQNWVMEFKRNLKNSADLGKWFKSQKQCKLDLDSHLKDFEVIGNIYENPELLEVEE